LGVNVIRNFVSCLAVTALFVGMAVAQSAYQPPFIFLSPAPDTVRQDFQENVRDVYFDFDRATLSAEGQATLAGAAEWLKAHPNVLITISGIADERGSIEYNLALSQQRAEAARDALVQSGVPENQIVFVTGWGKLYPICTESSESCWSQNRRSHLAPWPDANAWLANGATNWQRDFALKQAEVRE
jgi:outer membrane protein OmpA-like peptidoglycan-associated protein